MSDKANILQLAPPVASSVDPLTDGAPVSQVQVMNWKPVAARLFSQGTSMVEIAQMVKVDLEQVQQFFSSYAGQEAVRGHVNATPKKIEEILKGNKFDSVMLLIRLQNQGKSETTRLHATRELLNLGRDLKPVEPETPEQAKQRLESAMKQLTKD
jgi:hypothetical protein